MIYRLVLSPRACKDLSKLESPIRQKIDRAFFGLIYDPRKASNLKFLKDDRLADFRIRVGDYRILYDVYDNDKVIYVLRIGHRKDIYR